MLIVHLSDPYKSILVLVIFDMWLIVMLHVICFALDLSVRSTWKSWPFPPLCRWCGYQPAAKCWYVIAILVYPYLSISQFSCDTYVLVNLSWKLSCQFFCCNHNLSFSCINVLLSYLSLSWDPFWNLLVALIWCKFGIEMEWYSLLDNLQPFNSFVKECLTKTH